jgi:hypothetical protein
VGYKIVKYLRSIELIAEYQTAGDGQGGSREDTMFYGRGTKAECAGEMRVINVRSRVI